MYVIVNTYDRGPDATDISEELWKRHVPTMQAMPGFVSTCAAESLDGGSTGVSITFFETREAAEAYVAGATAATLDREATFRSGSDRRIYRVLNSTLLG